MYCGFIVEIAELHKHSNADRLQCVEVFGNNVIVDLSYKEGQKCVFFPVDGQLNEEFAKKNNLLRIKEADGNYTGGYMDPDKRNIKAIRLRGEKSEGLLLPVESLSDYTNISELQIGDKITILNGVEICKKYIPPRKNTVRKSSNSNSKSKKSKNSNQINFPIFKEHSDTEQLMYNKSAFHEGDRCIITLKMHGTSARTANSIEDKTYPKKWYHKMFGKNPRMVRQWKMISGTRRVVLDNFDDGSGYYGNNAFRKPYHDFFNGKLEKGEEIFYEIVGYVDEKTPIMGSVSTSKLKDKELKKLYGDTMVFSYGCKEGKSDIYVYRMTMTNEDGHVVEYPDWLMRLRCEQMGVKCVPKFDEFTFTTWEDLMERVEKYYDGPDPIGGTHCREGVVVRIENREKFKAYKHKNFTFKLVSGLISETINTDNMSEDMLSEL